MEEKNKNQILDFIIKLVDALKAKQTFVKVGISTIFEIKYILNQTLRHYQIPKSHYCASEKAVEMWKFYRQNPLDLLGFDSNGIVLYRYNERIVLPETMKLTVSNGASNNLKQIENNNFVFHKVFHEEHIVPIKSIINELIKLDDLSYDNVLRVLDKIYICKMLKTEDRQLKAKSKRCSTNYMDIINNEYKKAGIKVLWGKDIK